MQRPFFHIRSHSQVGDQAMPWGRRCHSTHSSPAQQNESEGEDGFKRVRRFDLCCVGSQDPSISRLMGFGDRLNVGHLGGERAQGWCSGLQLGWQGVGSVWNILFPREKKAQAWHTLLFILVSAQMSHIQRGFPYPSYLKWYSDSTVFYYNLVFSLKLWNLEAVSVGLMWGSLGERKQALLYFVALFCMAAILKVISSKTVRGSPASL